MAGYKTIVVIMAVNLALTACSGQGFVGKPHYSQGWPHELQEKAYSSQVGPHESQGAHYSQLGPHESQGAHESQAGSHEWQEISQISQVEPRESQEDATIPQGGPHEVQGESYQIEGRVRRQAAQVSTNQFLPVWTSCDSTTQSKISCHDCKTRIICKSVGGILKTCGTQKPFCTKGLCSAVPSAGCS